MEEQSRSRSRHERPRTTLEDLMVSPKFHQRGASREREGLSLTPTSRRRGSLVDVAKSGIASPPLLDDDDDAAAAADNKSTRSRSTRGTKLKKRSKSKDSAKAAAKEKARSRLTESGYGSDGVLEDVKKRHRERRKNREARDKPDADAYAYPDADGSSDPIEDTEKSPKGPDSRQQALKSSRGASEPSLSPKRRDRSKSAMRRIANIFKAKDQSTTTNNTATTTTTSSKHLDSISTLNTEEASLTSPGSSSKRDNSLRSVRSISTSGSGRFSTKATKAKKRSSSSGPLRGGKKNGTSSASSVSSRLSDTPSVVDEPLVDAPDTPKSLRKKGSSSHSRSHHSRSRSRSSERLEDAAAAAAARKKNSDGTPRSLEEQVEDLRDENIQLQQQVERERQRSKRLSKKLKELRTQVETGDAASTPVTSPTHSSAVTDPQTLDLKHELARKDDRIFELERLVSSLKAASKPSDYALDDGSNHDSIGSLGSCRSNRGNDAIWHRLQTQLTETREELTRTEELLRAQTANLLLKAQRVEELEDELQTNGVDTIRILKEKCNLLQEENNELETRLNAERREFEDRMQKKDEAIIYFRNELQKIKQQGNVDLQRTLVHAASQHSFLDGTSTHSTQTHQSSSSTVQRAFGGLTQLVSPALWSKDKVTLDRGSLETPRLDF